MVIDFGCSPYETVYQKQKTLLQERLANRIPDTLLVGEHFPVITVGRGTDPRNLVSPAVPVVAVERGGDVTYHGPGQLVAYPIRLLAGEKRDLHRYLRDLEEILIQTLAAFGVTGFRNPGKTGVWVLDREGCERKVASIGVAVKQWVTYHGVALNVSTDLAPFRQINPCGLDSAVMITLNDLLTTPACVSEVKTAFVQAHGNVFDR